jgi:oxygen-dependent protoporphyrinogen oxidase
MRALIDAIVGQLRNVHVHTDLTVAQLQPIDSVGASTRWRLHSARGAQDPSGPLSIPFDGLVLALPGPVLFRLLGPLDRSLANELGGIEHASSAVICLGYQRNQLRHQLDAFGLVVPQAEQRRILSVSFSSQKFPQRAPTGHVLLRVFIGGALHGELVELADDQLVELARGECEALLGAAGEPTVLLVQRWPQAMPQYHVGHLGRVARIEGLLERWPTLEITSNALRGVGIPQCVRDAERAAQRLVATLAHTDQPAA